MRVTRLGDGPIVDPGTDPSIGINIQGPSLIRVPDWLPDPLGRYYLYFADHKGGYIRLAYADDLLGPWTVYRPGTLHLATSGFLTEPPVATIEQLDRLAEIYVSMFGRSSTTDGMLADATTPHIASPDVHVDDADRRIRMYFHGLDALGWQVTRVAVSADGVDFRALPEVLGRPYLRAFAHEDMTYALTMPGVISRSADGLTGFEEGPTLFEPAMRHAAVQVRGDRLHVLWTRVGDAPESILWSTIELTPDWHDWTESEPQVVLRPEHSWEGADAPNEPSRRSVAPGVVNQLRDPALFVDPDSGRTVMLYAVAGERGIAIARVDWD
jgi:hypothetical protein